MSTMQTDPDLEAVLARRPKGGTVPGLSSGDDPDLAAVMARRPMRQQPGNLVPDAGNMAPVAGGLAAQNPFGFQDPATPGPGAPRFSGGPMGEAAAPPQAIDLGNGQYAAYDASGAPVSQQTIREPPVPGFLAQTGRGIVHGAAMGLPRGVPWFEELQKAESIRNPGNMIGQGIGSLTGMVNPANAAETALSVVSGGAIRAAPIFNRIVGAVGSKLGPRAAAIVGNTIEEGGQEAAFAFMQQSEADADLWLSDPAAAFGRAVTAAASAGAVGGMLGGGMAAVGRPHGTEATPTPTDPEITRAALDAMAPRTTSLRADPQMATPIEKSGQILSNRPTPANSLSRDAGVLPSTGERAALESDAQRLGIPFTPRTRTADLRRAVEDAARREVPPASDTPTPRQTQSETPAEAPSVIPSPAEGTPQGGSSRLTQQSQAFDPERRSPVDTQAGTNPETPADSPPTRSTLEEVPSPNPTPRERKAFTTSKGSTYEIVGQGTRRWKYDGSVHAPSDRTVYVGPDAMREIVSAQSLPEGTIRMQGERLIASEGHGSQRRITADIPYETSPRPGLHPVETWNKTASGEVKWHVGDQISDLAPKPEAIATPTESSNGEIQKEEGQPQGLLKNPPSTPPPIESRSAGAPDAPESITSARKAMTAADREAMGLAAMANPERHSWEAALDEARKEGLHTRDKALSLADEVNTRPRAFSDVETGGLVQAASDLKKEHAKLLSDAQGTTDPAEIFFKASQIDRVETDFDNLTQALRKSGTEKGRALAAQKLTLNSDNDLVSVITRAKVAKGSALTPEQRATFESLTKRATDAEAKLADLQKQVAEQAADQTIKRHAPRKRRMEPKAREAEYSSLLEKAKSLISKGCD